MDPKKPENVKSRRFSALFESYELLKKVVNGWKEVANDICKNTGEVKSQLGEKQF